MYYNIAISGGGANVLAFIGCVKLIQEREDLFALNNFIGSSAGSVVCLFMILNYKIDDIVTFLKKELIQSRILKFSFSRIFKITKTLGFDDGKRVVEFVESILLERGYETNITFMDLTKITGKNLIIAVTNLTQQKLEYISVDNYPDMKISTAIRMSTAIPILFEPVKYYEDLYVDSVVYNNFPLEVFTTVRNETIGLNVVKNKQNITGIVSYINTLISCVVNNVAVSKNSEQKNVCNIVIDCDNINFNIKKFKFELDESSVDSYVKLGYSQFKYFLG
jgi:predicted acylesterase/phospholipase RssA